MKILMLLHGDFPPDIRVEKEARCLSRRHQIILLANNRKGNASLREKLEGVTVYRMAPEKRGFKNVPFFMNPFWIRRAFSIIRSRKIDAIHIHDLPLAFVGIVGKLIFRLPVNIDLHENYPEVLKIWGKKGKMSALLRNPRLASVYERISLKVLDHVIVVDKNHKDYLISRMRLPPGKISVVDNSVEFRSFTSMSNDRKILKKYTARYVVLYVGHFGVERGLDVAIQAVPRLLNHIPNLLLLLVGDGPNRIELETLVSCSGVGRNVEFTGWVDFHRVASYMKASRICIIPQPGNVFIDNTIPHKLFQYMAMRKPVLAADAKAVSRIIRETGCGEVFVSGSSGSFAEGILKIRAARKEYGKNGQDAVKTKYDWNRTSVTLSHVYE